MEGAWPKKAIHIKFCGQDVVGGTREYDVSEISEKKSCLEQKSPHQSKINNQDFKNLI